jgi:transposase
MVFRHISKDMKERALYLYRHRWISANIARLFGVSLRSICRWQATARIHGSPITPRLYMQGRPRTFSAMQLRDIVGLVAEALYLYLQEISNWAAIALELAVPRSTLSRNLREAGLTLKRLRKAAAKRDPVHRQAFRDQVQAHLLASQIVCLDETSKDNRTLYRVHGRAPAGHRAILSAPFRRGTRYSLVAALSIEGYVATRVVEGSVDGNEFLNFLLEDVVSVHCLQSCHTLMNLSSLKCSHSLLIAAS